MNFRGYEKYESRTPQGHHVYTTTMARMRLAFSSSPLELLPSQQLPITTDTRPKENVVRDVVSTAPLFWYENQITKNVKNYLPFVSIHCILLVSIQSMSPIVSKFIFYHLRAWFRICPAHSGRGMHIGQHPLR
jgi:hypothetical protein